MLKWFKKLKAIVRNYDTDRRTVDSRITELEKLIKDRTNIAVDANFNDASHVIVIGRYKNADYVQTFKIDASSLGGLIEQLRAHERHGSVKRVDVPPQFRAVIGRDAHAVMAEFCSP